MGPPVCTVASRDYGCDMIWPAGIAFCSVICTVPLLPFALKFVVVVTGPLTEPGGGPPPVGGENMAF
jgi:hypothetical protein